jgi:hypothetical protein
MFGVSASWPSSDVSNQKYSEKSYLQHSFIIIIIVVIDVVVVIVIRSSFYDHQIL